MRAGIRAPKSTRMSTREADSLRGIYRAISRIIQQATVGAFLSAPESP
jgi:hypothetical protein